jgi:CTP synthase (UTP-ammonia lyase)
VGQRQKVTILSDSRAAKLYGAAQVVEDYYCNYGVNPEYRTLLEKGGLRATGVGDAGEIRIVEIPEHPFFLATLFLPQARSKASAPHPLIVGYADAVAGGS